MWRNSGAGTSETDATETPAETTAETTSATSVIESGPRVDVGVGGPAERSRPHNPSPSDAECNREYFGDAAISLVAGSKSEGGKYDHEGK